MTVRRSLGAGVLALACLPVLVCPPASTAQALATGQDCEGAQQEDSDVSPVTGDNDANVALQVPEAQALARKAGKKPGEGIKVVVVDSGYDGLESTGPSPLEQPHGLITAAIIAGPDQSRPAVEVAIAPAARLFEGRFYDAPRSEEDDQRPPTATALTEQLNALAGRRKSDLAGNVIVVIPTEVMGTDSLEKAVDRLVDSGALVIAAAGDRPQEGDESFLKDYVGMAEPGEDAAADVWPAAADNELETEGVISVGVSVPGGAETVLRNSGIDLAAPGTDAVAKTVNGKWCVVTSISSHWAAAQVAGVAALVWSVHDDESAVQLRARLQGTASGNNAGASPLTGYGVVQPVEAIQRDLNGMDAQRNDEEVVRRAEVPEKRADLLADARENAVWWGLAGGGTLVVLLILRPVLARRRRAGSGVGR